MQNLFYITSIYHVNFYNAKSVVFVNTKHVAPSIYNEGINGAATGLVNKPERLSSSLGVYGFFVRSFEAFGCFPRESFRRRIFKVFSLIFNLMYKGGTVFGSDFKIPYFEVRTKHKRKRNSSRMFFYTRCNFLEGSPESMVAGGGGGGP